MKTRQIQISAKKEAAKKEAAKTDSRILLQAGKNYQQAIKTQKLLASKTDRANRHARSLPKESESWVTINASTNTPKKAARPQRRKSSKLNAQRLNQTRQKLSASCNCGSPECPVCGLAQTILNVCGEVQTVEGVLFNRPDDFGNHQLYIAYFDASENLFVISSVSTVEHGQICMTLDEVKSALCPQVPTTEVPETTEMIPLPGDEMTDAEAVISEPEVEVF